MALTQDIKTQLAQYLELLENNITFNASLDDSENSAKVSEFLTEIADMSPKISLVATSLERTPSFTISSKDNSDRIVFAGVPLGHEFTSFVLALLQVSGREPKITPKEIEQIKNISEKLAFTTYVSLTCHNCPDVVQALNIMSVLNPNISHTMVEGSMYQKEIDDKGILAVPYVELNGQDFSSGRMTMESILQKVVGNTDSAQLTDKEPFDVLVVGAGPSGASAAIYAARKGIRTGLVADTFGGQVLETLGIENMIGTPYTEGPKLIAQVEAHVNKYPVDIMTSQQAVGIKRQDFVEITLASGAVLKSKTAIISTGARWRNINVPGEKEFKTKGVAYCPHCDGPLFAGKDIAIIGGGNSGIEAAIDLAGLVKHVTVIEFLPELKADKVLQDRLKTLDNVTVITNAATQDITGDSTVNGITYADRDSNEITHLEVAGVFILIGLVPNTQWLSDTVECNKMGEIITDNHGATNIPGVFAAGDCTDSAYKQIIISMGSGATAALGAFDYLIRN